MTEVKSLSVARFNREADPAKHDPRTALLAALEWLDDPECETPDHIIVICGRVTEDGDGTTRFFQTGSYSFHSQVGLMWEAMNMVRESGKVD